MDKQISALESERTPLVEECKQLSAGSWMDEVISFIPEISALTSKPTNKDTDARIAVLTKEVNAPL